MHDSKFKGGGPHEPSAPLGDHAHGSAALLLTETLMHALVEKNVISREDFVEIVEGAAEVEGELISSNGTYPADGSGTLLSPLAYAFKRELGR